MREVENLRQQIPRSIHPVTALVNLVKELVIVTGVRDLNAKAVRHKLHGAVFKNEKNKYLGTYCPKKYLHIHRVKLTNHENALWFR